MTYSGYANKTVTRGTVRVIPNEFPALTRQGRAASARNRIPRGRHRDGHP